MNVYSPESTYYFLPTESQFRTDSSPWCERCDFAYHQPALVAELSAHQPGIWHLLTSDDILETAETLNRCQSQICTESKNIKRFEDIQRVKRVKEIQRETELVWKHSWRPLASLGISWRLLASGIAPAFGRPVPHSCAGPSTQARLESTQKLKHKTQNCSKTQSSKTVMPS